MYSSTEDYMQILRQRDYIGALEWVRFIKEDYEKKQPIEFNEEDIEKKSIEFNGEDLLTLAVFELVNHGFSCEDLLHVNTIYALLNDEDSIFIGEIAYAATVFCTAAMQYLVYHEHDLLHFYRCEEPLAPSAVLAWMERDNPKLTARKNSEELNKRLITLDAVLAPRKKLVHYQLQIASYITALQKAETTVPWLAERLGVAESLYDFLKEEIMVNPEVNKAMTSFIDTLRALEPFALEDKFLAELMPKSFTDRLVESSMQTFRFFKVQLLSGLLDPSELNTISSKPHT